MVHRLFFGTAGPTTFRTYCVWCDHLCCGERRPKHLFLRVRIAFRNSGFHPTRVYRLDYEGNVDDRFRSEYERHVGTSGAILAHKVSISKISKEEPSSSSEAAAAATPPFFASAQGNGATAPKTGTGSQRPIGRPGKGLPCREVLPHQRTEGAIVCSLPVRDYLGSVLPGLADFPINRVAELTPTAWAVQQPD
jgi:hypothetical protein